MLPTAMSMVSPKMRYLLSTNVSVSVDLVMVGCVWLSQAGSTCWLNSK